MALQKGFGFLGIEVPCGNRQNQRVHSGGWVGNCGADGLCEPTGRSPAPVALELRGLVAVEPPGRQPFASRLRVACAYVRMGVRARGCTGRRAYVRERTRETRGLPFLIWWGITACDVYLSVSRALAAPYAASFPDPWSTPTPTPIGRVCPVSAQIKGISASACPNRKKAKTPGTWPGVFSGSEATCLSGPVSC